MALIALALVARRRRAPPAPRDRWQLACWAAAAGLALMPALRSAGWVATLSLFAAAALASVGIVGARSWRAVLTAPWRGRATWCPGSS